MSIRKVSELIQTPLISCITDSGRGITDPALKSLLELSWNMSKNESTFQSTYITLKDLTDTVVHQTRELSCEFTGDKIFNNSLSVGEGLHIGPVEGIQSFFPVYIGASSYDIFSKTASFKTEQLSSVITNETNIINVSKTISSTNHAGSYTTNITPAGVTTTLTGVANTTTNLDTASNIIVTKKSKGTILSSNNSGNFIFTEDIIGTALHAKWSDLAECYYSDAKYIPGTLVKFGGKEEITIAESEANAIISSKPAYSMNDFEEADKIKLPIALVGRVPVRVIGKIEKFDRLVLSYTPGVAVARNADIDLDKEVIGVALESNSNMSEKLVLCSVKIQF